MSDLPSWQSVRNNGIFTGSEVAALAGLSKFATPWKLHARKLGQIPDVRESEAMLWGTLLESAILRHPALQAAFGFVPWQSKLGFLSQCPCEVVETDRVPVLIDRRLGLGGTPDAIGKHDGELVLGEVKTVGERAFQTWEPSDDTEPVAEGLRAPTRTLPDSYVVQVTTYLGLLGLDTAIVPVLIGGQRLEVHRVPFRPEWFAALSAHALAALDAIARGEEPPFDPYADGADVGHWLMGRELRSELVTVDDPAIVRRAIEVDALARLAKVVKREREARMAALAHDLGLAGIGKAQIPGLGKLGIVTVKATPERTVVQKAREGTRYARIWAAKDWDASAAVADVAALCLSAPAGEDGEDE